jgi:ABC-type phosphate transport system substrate-binding protein
MTRSTLLGAVSAAALTFSATAFAATPARMPGGGSTLAEFDYTVEFGAFNTAEGTSHPNFSNSQPSGTEFAPPNNTDLLYWPAGSGSGQAGLLYNNLTCDAEAVIAPSTSSPHCVDPAQIPAGTLTQAAYGASDATLSAGQYTGWTSGTSYTATDNTIVAVPAQQPTAGNLIELPSMGVGVSIPTVNSGLTSTSTSALIGLQDADLCGIFSGKITNWSTIANESYNKGKNLAAGTIQVVYRYDGSGTTFIFTEHLANVCPSLGTYPITFKATQKFASLFTNSVPPTTFVGASGSQNLASFLSGQSTSVYVSSGTAVTNVTETSTGSDVGYLSPDFTFIDPNSNAFLNNGAKSTLLIGQIYNSTSKKYVLPTYSNVALALTHITSYDTTNGAPTGANPPASVAQAEANNAFVPVPVAESQGYPLVGYTTFDLAQCYANKTIGSALVAFLGDHYNVASYQTTEENNGFVPLKLTASAKYTTAIATYIFVKNGGTDYGTEIESASGCAGKAGR